MEKLFADKPWQIGRSKVFLKEELQGLFEARSNLLVADYCVVIARMYKGYVARQAYRAKRAAAVVVRVGGDWFVRLARVIGSGFFPHASGGAKSLRTLAAHAPENPPCHRKRTQPRLPSCRRR